MGSSCLMKTCTTKKCKQRGASFHRLPWRLPGLQQMLERVFGAGQVRELTRWSRICSSHIGQLAPLANSDEVARGLMEYYAWNARSYKRLFEIAHQDVKVEGSPPTETQSSSWSSWAGLDILREASRLVPGVADGHSVASGDGDSLSPTWNGEGEDDAGGGVESGHALRRFLLDVWKTQDRDIRAADDCLGSTSMIPEVVSVPMDTLEEDPDGHSGDTTTQSSMAPMAGDAAQEPVPPIADVNGEFGQNYIEDKEDQKAVEELEGLDEGSKESDEDDDGKLVINEDSDKRVTIEDPLQLDPLGITHSQKSTRKSGKRSAPFSTDDEKGSQKRRKSAGIELVELDSVSSVPKVEENIDVIKRDLQVLELLLRQKEEEWNSLLRLQKHKEELLARLTRKRNVMNLKSELNGVLEPSIDNSSQQEVYPSDGSPNLSLMLMSHLLAGSGGLQALQVTPQIITKSDTVGGISDEKGLSVIDIHTGGGKTTAGGAPRITMSAEAHNKLSRQLSSAVKPILPKLNGNIGSLGGVGPQGPTVSVQQIIAAHRKVNPSVPLIRGAKRGSWRTRVDSDRSHSVRGVDTERPPSVSSSSSEAESRGTAATKVPMAMSDPSLSCTNFLLQFAQLTQAERQPGAPQISIFPVLGEQKKSESSPPGIPGAKALEAPSALAKLLLESRGNGGSGSSGATLKGGDTVPNSQFLTLASLLSGSTAVAKETPPAKEKSQRRSSVLSEGKGKKAVPAADDTNNPKCQGCHKQRAQFVCAGCGNQWYCSRECQVAAWEDHSESCNS